MDENVEPVPQEAIDVVLRWADAALAGDFPTMWGLMDADFRLAEAQRWVLSSQAHPGLEGEDRDELAHDLAQFESGHRLRPIFEDARMAATRRHLPTWPRERWTPSVNRTILGEDLDEVRIRDPEAPGKLDSIPSAWMCQGGWLPLGLRGYVVRFSAFGWSVAGINRSVAVPGWPPSWV